VRSGEGRYEVATPCSAASLDRSSEGGSAGRGALTLGLRAVLGREGVEAGGVRGGQIGVGLAGQGGGFGEGRFAGERFGVRQRGFAGQREFDAGALRAEDTEVEVGGGGLRRGFGQGRGRNVCRCSHRW